MESKEPGWVARIREQAAELAQKMQWQEEADSPTMKKYTDFSRVDFGKYETVEAAGGEDAKKGDGNFHLEFSDFAVSRGNAKLPKGAIIEDLASAFEKHGELAQKYFSKAAPPDSHKAAAIHYSRPGAGVFVYVPQGVALKEPIRVRNSLSASGKYFGFHTIVIGEPGSKFSYLEEHESVEGCDSFASSVCEVFAHEGAKIDFCSMQKHSDSVKEYSLKRSQVGKGAQMDWFWGVFGAGMSMGDSNSTMLGEGGSSDNFGVFYNSGRQHSDISANVSHIAPNATSEIFSRGIVTDSATSVYRGLIKIGEKAVNTASGLEEKTLLLGEKASASALPSLIIDTNDVTAKHAAAVGKLDSEQLFYLSARGIRMQDARRLVVSGFVEPVLARMPHEVRSVFDSELALRISRL